MKINCELYEAVQDSVWDQFFKKECNLGIKDDETLKVVVYQLEKWGMKVCAKGFDIKTKGPVVLYYGTFVNFQIEYDRMNVAIKNDDRFVNVHVETVQRLFANCE